jgi:transposase
VTSSATGHNRGGNRALNKVIHVAAISQIRNGGQGCDHYLRKLGEGEGWGEAMRSLKRQLSDVIYRRLVADARRREAAREGQCGNET